MRLTLTYYEPRSIEAQPEARFEGQDDEDKSEDEADNASDSDVEIVSGPPTAGRLTIKWRRPTQRKLYAAALNDWLDQKYESPECEASLFDLSLGSIMSFPSHSDLWGFTNSIKRTRNH
jgi:hypothetical protein